MLLLLQRCSPIRNACCCSASVSLHRSSGTLLALPLLALTPEGTTRTYSELHSLCLQAGFSTTECVPLPSSSQSLIIGYVQPPAERVTAQTKAAAAVKARKLQDGQTVILSKEALKAAREDFPSPEETTWNYPMSLGGTCCWCYRATMQDMHYCLQIHCFQTASVLFVCAWDFSLLRSSRTAVYYSTLCVMAQHVCLLDSVP